MRPFFPLCRWMGESTDAEVRMYAPSVCGCLVGSPLTSFLCHTTPPTTTTYFHQWSLFTLTAKFWTQMLHAQTHQGYVCIQIKTYNLHKMTGKKDWIYFGETVQHFRGCFPFIRFKPKQLAWTRMSHVVDIRDRKMRHAILLWCVSAIYSEQVLQDQPAKLWLTDGVKCGRFIQVNQLTISRFYMNLHRRLSITNHKVSFI